MPNAEIYFRSKKQQYMWPAIIGAVGGVTSSLVSAASSSKAARRQYSYNRQLMAYQDELNRNQYEWQYNKFLSPSAMREAYERAGLNINDVGRQGGSMVSAGQLGSVSGTSSSAVVPDVSGLSQAGQILSQGAKTASETKLNLQKAITEEKVQYLHSTQSDLNLAIKDDKVADAALKNVNLYIAERTKDNKVRMSDLELQSVSKNLEILSESLIDYRFKNQHLNPAALANAEAQYASTIAGVLLTMSDVELNQAEYQYLIARVQTEYADQALKSAQSQQALATAYYNRMAGDEKHWSARIERQKAVNNYGVHLANDVKFHSNLNDWQSKVAKRTYKWMPVKNTVDIVNKVVNIAQGAVDVGAAFATGGLSKVGQAFMKSKTKLFESMSKSNSKTGSIRTIVDKNGEVVGGFQDVITW